MEYKQLTLDDWLNIKEKLRKQLQDVSEGFVRIGYQLKQIKEQRLYERDGYKDLAGFAKQEYGLSASTVSRFIAINTKYSIGGNSELLRPEFMGIGSSKLGEMLTIRDEDMELIGPATTRESIRDLKRFEKEEKAADTTEVSDRESVLYKITEEFFRGQPDLLNEICFDGRSASIDELINPSGNRTFRTGIYFVSFFDSDKGIKVKAFGQSKPESYTWDEFEYAVDNIFEPFGVHTWAKHYDPDSLLRKEKLKKNEDRREDSKDVRTEDVGYRENGTDNGTERSTESDKGSVQGAEENSGKITECDEETVQSDTPDTEAAGNRKSDPNPDILLGTAVPEHPEESGVHDHTSDEPEEIPPEDTEVVPKEIAPAQKYGLNTGVTEDSDFSEKTMITRKKYMESMSTLKMAEYLSSHLSTSTLKNLSELTNWLLDRVEV